MTIKAKGRKIGRQIRRHTGIPFPVAMRAGKLIARGRNSDLVSAFPDVVEYEYYYCGPECCGPRGYKLVGPKGEYLI